MHPPSNPFLDLMNCIVYIRMCVCVEREGESFQSSLLLKLKLCYHSPTLPTHPCQPVGNRLSFRVRTPTLQLWQSFSSLYLSFPIPKTRLRTLYNIHPLPLRILHKDCFCSFFLFFLYLIYFYYYYFVVHFFSCRLDPRIACSIHHPHLFYRPSSRVVLPDFIYLFLFFCFCFMFFVSQKSQRFTFERLRVLYVYVTFKRKYEKLFRLVLVKNTQNKRLDKQSFFYVNSFFIRIS